jgi:hypothetical protein
MDNLLALIENLQKRVEKLEYESVGVDNVLYELCNEIEELKRERT